MPDEDPQLDATPAEVAPPEEATPAGPSLGSVRIVTLSLANARHRAAVVAAEWNATLVKFATEHEAQQQAFIASKNEVKLLEDRLRTMAEQYYEVTKEKRPVPGVEVKVGKVTTYPHDKALEYCHAKGLPQFIFPPELNAEEFDSVALSLVPELCTTVEVPKTTISKDLDKALDLKREPVEVVS